MEKQNPKYGYLARVCVISLGTMLTLRYETECSLSTGECNDADGDADISFNGGARLALCLRNRGQPVSMYGFAGGYFCGYLKSALKDNDISDMIIETHCPPGICVRITDRFGVRTDITSHGGHVTTAEYAKLSTAVKELRGENAADYAIICGPYSDGIDSDSAARLCAILSANKCRVVLCCRGAQMRNALKEKPFMLVADRIMLRDYYVDECKSLAEYLIACRRFNSETAANILCAPDDGVCIFCGGGQMYSATLGANKRVGLKLSVEQVISAFLWAYEYSVHSVPVALRFALSSGYQNAGGQEEQEQRMKEIVITEHGL